MSLFILKHNHRRMLMTDKTDFEKGRAYFKDKNRNFKDCTTAAMINGWNDEERISKGGFRYQNWYQERNCQSF